MGVPSSGPGGEACGDVGSSIRPVAMELGSVTSIVRWSR